MKSIVEFPFGKMIAKESVSVGKLPDFLSEKWTADVRAFHRSIPEYAETPLIDLKQYAIKYGVKSIVVKDESKRFGLNAFKGLGGTYALYRIVCEKLGLDSKHITLQDLQKRENKEAISNMVFITTTDGNHGKGVSWAAGLLGCKA